MRRLTLFLVLAFPLAALAQAAAPVAASWTSLLTLSNILWALGLLSGGATLIFGANAIILKRRLALIVSHSFAIVEDLDAELANTKLDKTLEFLKAANDFCVANGWRSLKPNEVELAKLMAKAKNGEAEAAEAVQTKALIAAAMPRTPDQAAAIVAGLK